MKNKNINKVIVDNAKLLQEKVKQLQKENEGLIYNSIRAKKFQLTGICQFNEESKYVYPKGVDYRITGVYAYSLWEDLPFIKFEIESMVKDTPMCEERPYTSSVISNENLIIKEFNLKINNTDIEINSFDEFKKIVFSKLKEVTEEIK